MSSENIIPSCASLGCVALNPDYACYFEADSDIAGIGIIIAFIIPVCLTFAFVLFGFYFVEDGFAPKQLNPLDRLIINHANKLLHTITKRRQRLVTREAFRLAVLSLNDVSLVTGLSMLITAYSKTGTVTMYHFAIAGDLAGLAFTIQVCAARVTGEDLQRTTEKLWWRATAILIISLSLLVLAVPYGNRYYLEQYGASMQCLWESTSSENYRQPFLRFTMVLWMLLQLWATLSVLDKLFPTIYHNESARWLGARINELFLFPRKCHFQVLKKESSCNNKNSSSIISKSFLTCLSALTYAASLSSFTIAEVAYSEALEMTRNWSFLVVNIIDIFYLRSTSTYYGKIGNEDEWKFGQITPMVLLLVPLGTLSEVLVGGVRLQQENRNVAQGKAVTVIDVHSVEAHTAPTATSEEKWYYFGYPADRLSPDASKFEEELYAYPLFCLLLPGILLAIVVLVTYGAAKGWAL